MKTFSHRGTGSAICGTTVILVLLVLARVVKLGWKLGWTVVEIAVAILIILARVVEVVCKALHHINCCLSVIVFAASVSFSCMILLVTITLHQHYV